MQVRVYDGSSDLILTSYGGVTTATINSNGSVSVTRNLTSPDGQAMFTLQPSANKIIIERSANE
jgi:hypothetical protein